MKLSNINEAMKLIQQRAKLIKLRAALSYKDVRVYIEPNESAHCGAIQVTEMIDTEAVRIAVCETYTKRINQISMDLKEFGVYVDTDDAIVDGYFC
jgi:hypothetical protein